MRYIKGQQSPGTLPLFFSQTGNRPPRNTARKQQVPRFMKKNGLVNIRQDSKEKFERFISDFFTTMGLDLTWNDLDFTSAPPRNRLEITSNSSLISIRLHPGFTSTPSRRHPNFTPTSPRIYLDFTSIVPRLYLNITPILPCDLQMNGPVWPWMNSN